MQMAGSSTGEIKEAVLLPDFAALNPALPVSDALLNVMDATPDEIASLSLRQTATSAGTAYAATSAITSAVAVSPSITTASEANLTANESLAVVSLPEAVNVSENRQESIPEIVQLERKPRKRAMESVMSVNDAPTSQSDVAVSSVLHQEQEQGHETMVTGAGHKKARVDGKRLVYICGKMLYQFLDIAAANTAKGIETCAVLAGTMNQDAIYVTTLIIPQQSAGTDWCTTEDEEDLCVFQAEKDLMTIGWLHTHPTQSCFLSSIDLHTQFGYQAMIDEAIAIVLAPRATPSCGLFCLTAPYGLELIRGCPLRGFHPHNNASPIYETTGHVVVDWQSQKYVVVDLRKAQG